MPPHINQIPEVRVASNRRQMTLQPPQCLGCLPQTDQSPGDESLRSKKRWFLAGYVTDWASVPPAQSEKWSFHPWWPSDRAANQTNRTSCHHSPGVCAHSAASKSASSNSTATARWIKL